MATSSPLSGVPIPGASDPDNVPSDLALIADRIDSRLVMRFADAAARDATITSPVNGMLAILTTTGKITAYDGTSWRTGNLPLSGTSANRPAASTVPEGTIYYETDTDLFRIQQTNGGTPAWKTVNMARAGTKANRPAASAVPAGTLYYSTDLDLTHVSTGSAWNLINGKPTAERGGNDPSALTINATERKMVEIVIPAEAEFSRKVLIVGFSTITTTDNSTFTFRLDRNAITQGIQRVQGPSGGGLVGATIAHAFTLSAGATAAERTVGLYCVRLGGTGTATGVANTDAHRLEAIVVPAN